MLFACNLRWVRKLLSTASGYFLFLCCDHLRFVATTSLGLPFCSSSIHCVQLIHANDQFVSNVNLGCPCCCLCCCLALSFSFSLSSSLSLWLLLPLLSFVVVVICGGGNLLLLMLLRTLFLVLLLAVL